MSWKFQSRSTGIPQLSTDNIRATMEESASRNVQEVHCIAGFYAPEPGGLAQVGKYRSTSYVWRQSGQNLRRVKCTGS